MSFLDEIGDLHEGQRLEMKRADFSVPRDIWETYSAFANTEGGEIVLGVEEYADGSERKYRVSGVDDPDRLKKQFWDQIRDQKQVSADILPTDAVRIADVQGKQVMVITVPKANRFDKP